MNRSTALRAVAGGAVVLLAACQDVGPVGPDATAPDAAFSRAPQQAQGGPDRAALARAIPGFGGVFLDAEGVPTVQLMDVAERPRAEQAMAALLRAHGFAPGQLRVRRGDFDYASLDAWFERLWPEALAEPGVVLVDFSETRNRVIVGVENLGSAGQMRAIAARLGIPDAALVVEQVEPIVELATLRDAAASIGGGVQIHFGNYLCTLGFNALSGTQESFITNSHCTNIQGGVEGTQYYQPLSSVDPTVIGTEVDDPDYFRNGPCPRGGRCRYSDAARVRQESGRTFTRGQIKKVQSLGSLTITGDYTITAKFQQPGLGQGCVLEGTVLNKTGRTTGWSLGPVSNSCVTVGVSGTNKVQLYQTIVVANVAGGDSGSPVWQPAGGDNVMLHGILWGGGSSTFVYSPIFNVEYELGPLAVTGGGTPPPPPPPPPPGDGSMHVGDMDGTANVKGKSGKWSADATVLVHDSNHGAVAGAVVTLSMSGAATGQVSGTTDANGLVTLSTGNLSSGNSVTFTLVSVTHDTLTYADADTHDPDAGENGKTVTASR